MQVFPHISVGIHSETMHGKRLRRVMGVKFKTPQQTQLTAVTRLHFNLLCKQTNEDSSYRRVYIVYSLHHHAKHRTPLSVAVLVLLQYKSIQLAMNPGSQLPQHQQLLIFTMMNAETV